MDKKSKDAIKFIVKTCVFSVCLCLLIIEINHIFIAKYMFDGREPTTSTYANFYNMERDSVDMLILGTSHAASGFNPQDLYDSQNLRAYNLASTAQPVWISYYWLKEALHYQNPSVVVFDCNYLFQTMNNEGVNRKALDYMHWGKVKYEAVSTAIRQDTKTQENLISYVFPFFRYHTRWKALNEWDFTWASDLAAPAQLKGFWLYHRITTSDKYKPDIETPSGLQSAEFSEEGEYYLSRILNLCEENKIRLILVKTPTHVFTKEHHDAVAQWAAANSIPFLDFNDEAVLREMKFNYGTGDMYDIGELFAHPNPSGAKKLSVYLANYIVNNQYCSGIQDEQWEKSKGFNENTYEDFELVTSTDLTAYIRKLKEKRYTVVISTKGNAGLNIPAQANTVLSELGLEPIPNDDKPFSYLAVIDSGNVIANEQKNDGRVSYSGAIKNGTVRLRASSSGYSGQKASISFDGKEKSKDMSGINIVVYSNERKCVIDSVNFNTTDSEITCTR